MLSRRNILLAGASAFALSGCTAAQEAQFATDWSNFVDQVNSLLSKGCSALLPAFIATANTVEGVANVLYPSLSAAIAAGAAAVQAVAGSICSVVPSAPPASVALKLHRAKATGIATIVGNVNINGKVIPVSGYGVK